MYNYKTILGLIPARGGSKRLPGKNIKKLGNKPLIAWTIEAAKGSKYLDRIVVSTDSDKIIKVAEDWRAEVPFKRPNYLATDDSSSEDAIIHALELIKINDHNEYDYLVLLQPTSPFRTSSHIDKAIKQLISNVKADAIVGVYNNHFVDLGVAQEDEFCSHKTSLSELNGKQEHASYIINGAIYITKTSNFLEDKSFYKRICIPYVMEKKSSLDIDTKNDWLLAKKSLQ
jgi:CMP-N,N'-diacetyllegionaminic acid synthase